VDDGLLEVLLLGVKSMTNLITRSTSLSDAQQGPVIIVSE
jgi:hypothetical protein